ncbi:MAG: hypothetical protein IVW36_07580 [Dehalococcoidia bacterium]|nr:hypothetical protein [Dehalococcoidia bacterium]
MFTLPYSEYAVAQQLQEVLPKKDGYAISIPLGRQNKGWDLIAHSSESHRAATIQVKSSRSYSGVPAKTSRARKRFTHYFWFNNFEWQTNAADFYVLFGLYPLPDGKALDKSTPSKWWVHRSLLFTSQEMKEFLDPIEGKFFDFGFDIDNRHCLRRVRGAQHPGEECFEDFIFANRATDLRTFLAAGKVSHQVLKRH